MTGDARQDFANTMRAASAALSRKDSAGALDLLAGAAKLDPKNPDIQYNRSVAYKLMGDAGAALAALDAALALEPYHLPSIFAKGMVLEEVGRPAEAAAIYRNALAIAPTSDRLPPPLVPAHARAAALVRDESRRLNAFFTDRLDAARAKYPRSELKRFNESVEIFSGVTRAYQPSPSMLHFPALPPVSYFDRSLFPWFEQLEAASAVILGDLQAILASSDVDRFAPYVAYPPGAPVNQWGELNHSLKWSSYFLWRDGVRHDGACRSAPATSALLDSLPLMRVPDFAPTAMFSSLAPKTRIPPHTGSTNIRAIVHLPLILPGPAWFRVGNERREWRMGEAWAFDDTIEHEAMNESDETRIILIIDAWNPYLTQPERELVSLMLDAKDAFRTGAGAARETFG